MTRVEILIADDHEMVREGLRRIISESHENWEVVAEVSSGEAAVAQGLLIKPDVAILDLSMPGMNGLDAAERLIAELPAIKVLILTMHSAMPIRRKLEKVGVHAYLAKNEAPSKIVEAIERLLAGEAFFASESSARPASAVEMPEYVPVQFLLTPREITVLRLLAQGRSNKQLAGDLDMSVRTAESHRASILTKLGVESLGDLVRLAIRDKVV